jgi:predicted Zn finger-like uncharacterized protein
MSSITRCPACGTTYKVVPDQLKIAEGWLRCGQCQQAFDSSGLVLDWPDASPDASLDQASAPGGQRMPIDEFLKQEDRSPLAPAVTAVDAFEEALSSFKPQPLSPAEDPVLSRSGGTPDHAEAQVVDRPSRSWLVGVVGFLLLLALGLQLLWIGRHVLASTDPAVAKALNTVCRVLGCEVLPLQIKDAVRIESSSLTPLVDGLGLSWSVRNVTVQAVQMPALELSLLDAQDKTLVRRVLLVTELGAPSSLKPGQTWEGQLHLLPEVGLSPAGYRLLSFYP